MQIMAQQGNVWVGSINWLNQLGKFKNNSPKTSAQPKKEFFDFKSTPYRNIFQELNTPLPFEEL